MIADMCTKHIRIRCLTTAGAAEGIFQECWRHKWTLGPASTRLSLLFLTGGRKKQRAEYPEGAGLHKCPHSVLGTGSFTVYIFDRRFIYS